MKQAIRKIFPILLFLTGCGCFLYPVISNELAKRNHATIIENYDDTIEDTSKVKIEKYREDAQWYNQELVKNVVYSDPFDAEALKAQNENYDDLLNLNEDGVMGYLDIPVISCYLPIYHSTEQEILKKGVGHLINSSLPIGGKATHSVLSAHSGIASSKLFTDLNLVKEKDIFYIHVLDQTLTYEVDQIKVVKPEEISDLTIDLEREPSLDEISKYCNLPVSKVSELCSYMNKVSSLDEVVHEETARKDLIADTRILTPMEEAMKDSKKEVLMNLIGELPEKEQQILIMHFGLNDTPNHTLEEIGKQFNLTRERIRQLETKALSTLRSKFQNMDLAEVFYG